MEYLYVKNLEKWQHYKDRTPPWIKLHRDILNDYEFTTLEDHQKAHLMLIWVVASQMDNKIPNDPAWLARKIGATTDIDTSILIKKDFLGRYQDASSALAEVYQDAMRETETEGEKEKHKPSIPKPKPVKKLARPESVPESVWDDFMAIRKAKKAPLTETALKGIEREAKKAKIGLDDALRVCCERGWQSFKAEWNKPAQEKPFDPRDYV